MIRWLLVCLALLVAAPAQADELRPASIHFEQVDPTHWTLGWKQPLASPNDPVAAAPRLPANCRMVGEPVRRMAALAVIGAADVSCTGSVQGGRIAAPDLVVLGDALLRVVPLDGGLEVHRLTADAPAVRLSTTREARNVWANYFGLGIEHILEGWDHLAFVIALVLLVAKGWAVIKAATAFTLAHSLTLAAVTLGYAGMPQRPVEATIALTIVFLAVEVARGTRESFTRRMPWLAAFGFGLFHGFGFAGALREIGLPDGEIAAALVSFNLGVEAGQLCVIAVVLALRWLIARGLPRIEPVAVRAASYGIGIVGAYWLIDRVAG